VDKPLRLANGYGWWADEQPSPEIRRCVEARLDMENWRVDTVLSHTCPLKYEPREMFLSGIDDNAVDKSTERWLDVIEDSLEYSRWYCGHYHTDKTIDRLRFLFSDFLELR
jgi:3-oxoacid CoA-transferase subunit A